MKWKNLLFEANPDATGGGESGEGSGSPTPSSIGMESQVTLADGTTVSVGDLVQAREQVGTLEAQNQELQGHFNHVGQLFDPNTSAELREDATRNLLAAQGYTADQINEYVDSTGGEEYSELDESDYDDLDLDGNFTEGEDTTGMSSELKEIREAQAALAQQQQEMYVTRLRDEMNGALDQVIDGDAHLKGLFSKVEELRGKDKVEEARATIRQQIERTMLERLQLRKAQTAGNLELSWFGEEAQKAVDPVLSGFRSVIGDPNLIGRSPETVTEGSRSFLENKDPVPPPKFNPKDAPGTLDAKVKDFTTDALLRISEGMETGDSKI